MGNTIFGSNVEGPGTNKKDVGTEVPIVRDNDQAEGMQEDTVAARKYENEVKPSVRHNGAQRVGPKPESRVWIDEVEGSPKQGDEPRVLVAMTPEVQLRQPTSLFGTVAETPPMMTSPDSAYGSRSVEPDATEVMTPAATDYMTAEADRSASSRSPEPRKKLQWSSIENTGKQRENLPSNTKVKTPRPKTHDRKTSSKSRPKSDRSSSSSEDETGGRTKPRHILKPPKYDGTGSFETFMMHFQNCSDYNKWSKTEQLAYLRSSLEKEAAQVLWDCGTEMTESLEELTEALQERFGAISQAEKYRIEVKNRRRKTGESLQSLHSDIRRLVALAFSDLDHKARELMACDYFIDALNDPQLQLKVRERSPKNLTEALRIALQLELWAENVNRIHRDLPQRDRRAREITKSETKKEEANEVLKKQVGELQKQLTECRKSDLTEALTKRIAELESEIDEVKKAVSLNHATETVLRKEATTSAMAPKEFTPAGQRTCWGCGDPNHRLWMCPKLSYAEKARISRRNVRPIGKHCQPTCITVRYKGKAIEALVDTGCDVTIAGANLAKKHRWKIRPAELKSVKVANGEDMVIDGVTEVSLSVGKKKVQYSVHITPDITDLILGNDWMKKQGKLVWDFDRQQVQFGDGEWIALRQESDPSCRRIVVESDVELPPRHETEVPIRISRKARKSQPFEGVTECRKIPNLSHVYSSRTVLPAKFSQVKMRVVNADSRSQVLKKGTDLGKLERAEVIEPKTEGPKSFEPKSHAEIDAVQQMMDTLPKDLSGAQLEQVRELLRDNETIFSKGEYDIGRTPFVEYNINTGTHGPIRQPLRRHPFKYLGIIDNHVEEMKKHGIIEPAASPWASNVVLVKKKDNSLRFCIDYRQLNRVTTQDSYPLPLIDNCLNALQGSVWFSTLDLRAGYYNIPIAEVDKDKTAFITRSGCYMFTVMLFD